MQNQANPVAQPRRPAAVKAATLLAFASAGLFLALVGYALLALIILARHPADSSTAAGNFAATLLVGLGLCGAMLYGTAGLGLLKGRRWAWFMALILQALNLALTVNAINLELNPPATFPDGVSVSPAGYLLTFLAGWIALHILLLVLLFTPTLRRYLH